MTVTGPLQEQYGTLAADTLNGGITAGAASLALHSAALFPAVPQFRVRIDAELMLVTTVSGTTFGALTRGIEGTTAASHADGAAVTVVLTATGLEHLATNAIGDAGTRGQGLFLATAFEQSSLSLYLLCSDDGASWNLVRPDAVYAPASGVRDPSLYYDGTTYWCAYTRVTAPFGSWGIASSPDLVTWTHVTDIDETGITETDGAVAFAWSPEWFVDPADNSVHVVLTLGHTQTTMRLYETHPTAADMTAWSTAVKLTGTSLPTDVIDPFLMAHGGVYYFFYKNDAVGNKHVELMTSTSLTSGYTVVGATTWLSNWTAVSGNGWEGPSIVQLDATHWRLYVESTDVSDNGLGYFYSDYTGSPGSGWATGSNWSALTACTDPFTKRHGTVLRLQDLVTARNLIAGYLGGQRLKSACVHGSGQSVNSGSTTAASFSATDRDDGAYFDGSTKLSVTTSGFYHINGYIHWPVDSTHTGQRITEIRINGSVYLDGADAFGVNNTDPRHNVTALRYLNAGDYVELALFQSKGSAQVLSYSEFAITRLGG